MSYDPLGQVSNAPVLVTGLAMQQLTILRAADKFIDLPGINTTDERARLSQVLNELLDRLINGALSNPSKLWVLNQFQPSLETVQIEDTESREHFGVYLEQIMDILHIESSDGLLSFYL